MYTFWNEGGSKFSGFPKCTGFPKQNALKSVWIISPAKNLLEGLNIFHLKGGIHSFICITEIFCTGHKTFNFFQIKKVQRKLCQESYGLFVTFLYGFPYFFITNKHFALCIDALADQLQKRLKGWKVYKFSLSPNIP